MKTTEFSINTPISSLVFGYINFLTDSKALLIKIICNFAITFKLQQL
jgi:hypothetical protein